MYGASDFWTQLYLGSGGGCGTGGSYPNAGGGAIKIRAASLVNSGTISAKGATITSVNKCGGGSGGTIYLTGYPSGGVNFSNSGSGIISATGGTGGSLNGQGGKGRIRIEPAAILASLGTLDPAPDSAFFGSSAVPTSLTTVNLNDSTSASATQSTYTVAGTTYNIGVIGPAATGEAQFDVDTILSGKSIGTLAFGLNAYYKFNGNRSYTTLTTDRSTAVFNGNVTVSNGATFDRSTTVVTGDLTVASGATSLNPTGTAGTLTVSGTMTTAALTVGVATTLNAGALTTNGDLTTTGTSGVITSGNITVNGNMTVAALTSVTAPAFIGTWSGSAWSPTPGVGNGLLQLTVTGILNNAGTIQMDGKGFKGATSSSFKGNSNMGASSLATTDVTGGGGGGGSSASAYGAGASYGTLGTVANATGASAGQLYGASDFWTQLYLGSGGGCGTGGSYPNAGGGAIKIRAASLVNSGTISAKGATITSVNKCGGGSGGTIMMSAYPTGNITVTNSGTISATGGTGGSLNGLGGSGRFGLQAASTTLAGTVNPPATSVSATSPTIQNVTLTSPKNSGSVIAGVPLTFTVITSERITVTGTPTMPITIGGVAATASYISGSGTQNLLFRYTTVAGRDGVVAYGSPLALNGGTMLSATSVSLALTVMAGSTAVTVDTTAPSAPSVSPGSQAITSATTAYIYQGGSDVDFMDFRYATDLVSTLSCGSVTNLVTISMWQPTYVAIPMATTALRVIACDTNLNASTVALSTYTYFDTAPDVPYISPGTSVISGETSVYMSQNTWEADFKEFRYALDLVSSLTCTTTASTVSVSGAQYTYVTIPAATTTMRAIVCDAKGQASSIVNATYTLYDYSAPVPGMIKASTNVTGTGFTLNWEAATDTATAQADLQYKVCSSTDPNNVRFSWSCDYSATTVMDYTTNTLSVNVTGLTNDQVTYYNVMVMDVDGYTAMYNGKVQQAAPTTRSSMAFNDAVNAVAAGSDGTIYFGGAFTQVGANSGGLVQLSSSNGSLAVANSALTKVSGTIAATAADGSGGYYIGGSFTSVGGMPVNNLAHIDKYGNVDLAWNQNPNGPVNAIAVIGSSVYVGGAFTKIGPLPFTRNYLAALSTADGGVQAWDPNANNVVRALDVSGTILYVGGDFTVMNSVNRNYLAAFWTVDGTLDAWNPNANGNVYALDAVGTTIYAGGTFNTIGGVTRNRIAAIATSGDLRLWDANADNYVYAISVSGSTVYAGGAFTTIGGQARNRIAALDATSGVASTWNPNANNTVYALGVSGSVVYAGGDFTTIGASTRNYMAGIDATTAVANSFNPNVNNRVNAVSIYGSNVWAGGTFTGVNSTARNYLAAISPDGTLSSAWNPNANGIVRAMALSGTTLYIGGEFTTLGGSTTRNRLAAISTAGTLQAWNPNANLTVRALLISGSTVYAGGDFTTMGGATTRNRLASMNASTGALGSWNPNADSGVYALALSPDSNTIYVGGMFSSIGGQPRYGLASLDSTGVLGSWAPDTRADGYYAVGRVRALATIGNSVYVGGDFTSITANYSLYPVTYMAEIMSDGNMSWYPNLDAPVQTIMIYGRTIFAGGDFTIFNGSPVSRLAAFYASSKNFPTDWASSVAGSVYALASTTSDGYIYPVGSPATGFKPTYVGLPPVPPSAPTNVAASQSYNSMYMAYDVRLTWTDSTFAAGSIYGYEIAEDAGFTTMVAYYYYATSGSTGYTAQQYTSTTKTYYIRAYAYDNNTSEYVYSSVGQVTVTTGAGDTGGGSSSSSSGGYDMGSSSSSSSSGGYDMGSSSSSSSTGGGSLGTCYGDYMSYMMYGMGMITTNNCTSGMAMFDTSSPTYCTCY